MRRPVSVAVSVLVALALLACGDDGDTVDSASGGDGGDGGDSGAEQLSAEDQEYVDAAVDDYDPEDDAPLTEEDARCLSEAVVVTVGSDRLREIGIEPEDFAGDEDFPPGLTDAEANEIVDEVEGCIDLATMFIDGFEEDGGIDDETRDCLVEQFDGGVVRRMFVAIFTGDEAALAEEGDLTKEFMAIFQACPGAVSSGG